MRKPSQAISDLSQVTGAFRRLFHRVHKFVKALQEKRWTIDLLVFFGGSTNVPATEAIQVFFFTIHTIGGSKGGAENGNIRFWFLDATSTKFLSEFLTATSFLPPHKYNSEG